MARGFFGPRFGIEATFIAVVALVAGLLELSLRGIAAAVFVAWVVVAVSEFLIARRRRPAAAEPVPVARRPAVEPDVSSPPPPPLAVEQPPSESEREPHAPAPTEPDPAPEPEPAPESAPARERAPSAPAALAAAPESDAAPDHPDEREPEPAPPPVQLRPPAPREWNLWELERRARERPGGDPMLDDELSFLLLYLREFADTDGDLPLEFDPLVRESFGDLIGAER